MADVIIRSAHEGEGPAIGTLYRDAVWPDLGVDWARATVAGWWLVAEREGDLVGAIMFTCSQPIGYIGDLVIHPSVRRHGLARTLFRYAEQAMRQAGVQRMVATVSADQPEWRQAMQRWGGQEHDGLAVLMSKGL